MTNKKKPTFNRFKLIEEFEAAPLSTLLTEDFIAAVRQCSIQLVQAERVSGKGIPFVKIGRHVRYQKSDVVSWLVSRKVNSTSQYQTGVVK